jgi:Ni,Fe-hydrogenase III large subunit/Ni,Fe-hydrogenase III component G
MVSRGGTADWGIKMWPDFMERQLTNLSANIASSLLRVDNEQWLQTAEVLRASGARFLSLWGADDRDRDGCFRIYATFLLPANVMVIEHAIPETTAPTYPSIATFFPAALRMQRAVHDLLGISTEEPDTRGWLRHGGWSDTLFPLRRDVKGNQQCPIVSAPYPFVTVEGDGVHEIAVGPVHAGTIEPGHFRFSVVGEKVLRLEERLGYTHKGVAKLFESLTQQTGHRLAARVSGDSAVAFSWAYCAALEAVTQTPVPSRALNLRALALEHERLANHLGDLGALGNDAGFAFGLTQFSRFKEDLLRANTAAFGARYLMNYIVPGGIAVDMPGHARGLLLRRYEELEAGVANLRSIYDEHAGIQDRFREAGRLTNELAEKLGAIGLAGRASGIYGDLRVDHPWQPYDGLQTKLVTQVYGDVAARVRVRFDEIFESLRLCRALLEDISPGPVHTSVPIAVPGRIGLGLIEGWRGPVMIVLETGADGGIRHCHAHDPSWQNWPLIEYAILGNIVPDFPLINKSFNLSYSGQDG